MCDTTGGVAIDTMMTNDLDYSAVCWRLKDYWMTPNDWQAGNWLFNDIIGPRLASQPLIFIVAFVVFDIFWWYCSVFDTATLYDIMYWRTSDYDSPWPDIVIHWWLVVAWLLCVLLYCVKPDDRLFVVLLWPMILQPLYYWLLSGIYWPVMILIHDVTSIPVLFYSCLIIREDDKQWLLFVLWYLLYGRVILMTQWYWWRVHDSCAFSNMMASNSFYDTNDPHLIRTDWW